MTAFPPPPRRRWIAAALAPILALTLLPGAPDEALESASGLCLACGGKGAATALLNVLLFAPLGLALAARGIGTARAAGVGTLLALAIETAQLWLPGRHPSLGDIVMNAMGAGFGALAWHTARWWIPASQARAAAIAAAGALSVLATAWLLVPLPGPPPWYGQWTPVRDHYEWYRGRVLAARIGTHPLPARNLPNPAGVRSAFLAGDTMVIRAMAGPPTAGVGPLFIVSDARQDLVVLVGPDADDLVFRYRARADAWRLNHADLRLPHALAGVAPGDTLLVTARLGPGGACLSVNHRRECRAVSAGASWSLLYYPWFLQSPLGRVADMTWILLLGALSGAWARRPRDLWLPVLLLGGALALAPLVHPLVGVDVVLYPALGIGLGGGLLLRRALQQAATRHAPAPPARPRESS